MDLDTICKPIEKELEIFNKRYKESLSSDISLISKIMEYLLVQDSKKIRPILVLLSSKMCGEPCENTYISAVLVEMLHTATLLHDDVVDEADRRRGVPSINAIWQNKTSVLIGDWLFSRCLSNMIFMRDFDMLSLLSRTAELLSEGEIRQIEGSSGWLVDEESYYEMIFAKTASLFAASCRLGAMGVCASRDKVEALYDYGKNLGMAFQIKDDLLDFTGSEDEIGKPRFSDLKGNIMTLPLIYTLRRIEDEERALLREKIELADNEESFVEIIKVVEKSGGIEYSERKINEFSTKAIEALRIFPDSEVKSSMIGFVHFNKERKK